MKVAIYTLTRDRLEFTEHCFCLLKQKAGHSYDHFICDNGSQDGTVEWLKTQDFKHVTYFDKNKGITIGSNRMLEEIFATDDYDLIIKFDNDCEIVSDNIISQIVKVFEYVGENYALSPRIEGLNNPVKRYHWEHLKQIGYTLGFTGIIGGIFHCIPATVYRKYRYPDGLPLAALHDTLFCGWLSDQGIRMGYIEDLQANHYMTTNGQAEHYPDYFKRKYVEEKTR